MSLIYMSRHVSSNIWPTRHGGYAQWEVINEATDPAITQTESTSAQIAAPERSVHVRHFKIHHGHALAQECKIYQARGSFHLDTSFFSYHCMEIIFRINAEQLQCISSCNDDMITSCELLERGCQIAGLRAVGTSLANACRNHIKGACIWLQTPCSCLIGHLPRMTAALGNDCPDVAW